LIRPFLRCARWHDLTVPRRGRNLTSLISTSQRYDGESATKVSNLKVDSNSGCFGRTVPAGTEATE
jgi:hypothetical protein